MSSYEHKKLIEKLSEIDEVPADSQAYSEWIKADAHLAFLRENATSEELVIYASCDYAFIHSVAVSNDKLFPINRDDLMGWNLGPFASAASYVTGGEHDAVRVEQGMNDTGSETLNGAVPLVFCRTFEGWTEAGRKYYELSQEYSHLTEIHWRPERHAYCRFDEHGDLAPIVSVTSAEAKGDNVTLVSFKWEPLEEYLAATDSSLVRMFDFTLVRRGQFSGWSDEQPQQFDESDQFFYHRSVMPGHAAYTRGVQIVRPRRTKATIFTGMTNRWFGRQDGQHVTFSAYDWRNGRVTEISTGPSATTNYFNAKGNRLPYELSPAFFNPEVLLKYKTDRDKYTVGERTVSCRAAWHLKGIDVNEAGQVHAYICDLRHLPYREQLHWLSFNEPPKTGISKRAFTNDFQGEWATSMDPLQEVLSVTRRWHDKKVTWWVLRDEKLLDRVSTPLTASRDEWAESFMDLAKLVVEGFETKPIRAKLAAAQVPYSKEDRTIKLLERLLNKDVPSDAEQLVGLRTVQLFRSKIKGHAGRTEAAQLTQKVLEEHETFTNHFRHVCTQVAADLGTVETLQIES